MNLLIASILVVIFWLIGIHHYLKHPELKGIERFGQHKDIILAVWYIVKSHEGIQLIILILAAYSLIVG